jgi:hypothetical protein
MSVCFYVFVWFLDMNCLVCTSRNVVIHDLHPSSLKMINWSCTQISDELVTKLISSLKSRHIM